MLGVLAPSAAHAQGARVTPDTVASIQSTALLALVRNASEHNRLPDSLIAYKARVETEIGVVLRQEDGKETVASIEQIASSLRWTRTGQYDQHVLGYRAQQMGLTVSMLSIMREGWINPVLYGNRLRGRANPSRDADDGTTPAGAKRTRRPGRGASTDSIIVVHPLAVDRERYYRYSGGDTVVTLRPGGRTIPIVRVHVEPRTDIADTATVFVGDLELDASRGTLVQLRGYFTKAGKARHRRLDFTLADAIAFVEFENGEFVGEYWLPAMQRIELQVSLPAFGDGRAVLRIVSRFPDIAVNDTTLSRVALARADSVRPIVRRRLTYAPNDSLSAFSGWQNGLGAITAGMHSDDFDDIAPDRLRKNGAPRLDIAAPHFSDVLHFDRVEGWYTGVGAKLALRDAAPGVIVRANAGWAWSEQTARGRLSIERTRGNTTVALHAGRSLDNTNDFQSSLDSIPAVLRFGADDPFDYVDRRSAGVSAIQYLRGRRARVRVDYSLADDRYAPTTVSLALSRTSRFLPNRGVDEGGYRRLIAAVEWHPDVDVESVRPGLTARALYERGDGTLTYQRAELRATAREAAGPFLFTLRGDVGQLFGRDLPPQQLFELGKGQNLPGYDTKEFAGTRAAVMRTGVQYTSPFLRQPIRLTRRWWLPALAPGASIGLQSGWADAETAAGRAAILRLGTRTDSLGVVRPVSRVTGGVRTTASVGLRLFSGSVFIGIARPVDHAAKWKLLVGGGSGL